VAARVDSPSTAIRRFHLFGYYCQNSQDHLLSIKGPPLRSARQVRPRRG